MTAINKSEQRATSLGQLQNQSHSISTNWVIQLLMGPRYLFRYAICLDMTHSSIFCASHWGVVTMKLFLILKTFGCYHLGHFTWQLVEGSSLASTFKKCPLLREATPLLVISVFPLVLCILPFMLLKNRTDAVLIPPIFDTAVFAFIMTLRDLTGTISWATTRTLCFVYLNFHFNSWIFRDVWSRESASSVSAYITLISF